MRYSLCVWDPQTLPLVHVEGAGSLAVAVAFRAVLLAVACLAVDFIAVNSHSCAVQVLPADHWTHADMETRILMLLFCMFACLRVFERVDVFVKAPESFLLWTILIGLGCAHPTAIPGMFDYNARAQIGPFWTPWTEVFGPHLRQKRANMFFSLY